MSFVYRLIARIPNYIKSFGIFHGLRLLVLTQYNYQYNSKGVRKYKVPSYPDSIYLRNTKSDVSIFWQCIVQHQYDVFVFPQSQRLMSIYRDTIEKGLSPLIIDCGGNIGLSALYYAMTFPEAKIYVIEPDKENFELLNLNTSCFGDRVVPLLGGIWHESGNLEIVNPESGSASFRVEAASSSNQTIRAYTINEICALAGTESPLIVKIDIEGGQANLFKDNTSWVADTHLVALELDDWQFPWQGNSRPFFSCVSKYAFDYLISGETIFCFRDLNANSTKT